MVSPKLHFDAGTPFSENEQSAINSFWEVLTESKHSDSEHFQKLCLKHIERIHSIRDAMNSFPAVLEEKSLGRRERSLFTLVELIANATDADYEMYLPTRSLLWRSITMARLNFWRLVRYLTEEVAPADDHLFNIIENRVHACVYLKLAEELLLSVAMDSALPRSVRDKSVRSLTSLWDATPSKAIQKFFPLLEAVWDARRNIVVSVGTLLGISEIMRLLQAGCAPEFVDHFCRERMSRDEGLAFQEFLIGVSSEQLHDLEQLMAETGRTSITPEEAEEALGLEPSQPEDSGIGVEAYHFHRERHLQAAARRLRHLPGPKHTAEEYMLVYFLEDFPAEDTV
ncbi:MAG: hypothetical protein ACI84O_000418 [Myxococcota bacterium]